MREEERHCGDRQYLPQLVVDDLDESDGQACADHVMRPVAKHRRRPPPVERLARNERQHELRHGAVDDRIGRDRKGNGQSLPRPREVAECPAEQPVHDAGRLNGRHRRRSVQHRAFDRPRSLRIGQQVRHGSRGDDDHRDVRTEEEQGREVDDEGERHHAAVFGRRPLDGKHRRQDRGNDQSRELEGAIGLRPAQESQEHDCRGRGRREDEQAGVTWKPTHLFQTAHTVPDRSRGGRQGHDQTVGLSKFLI